MFKKILLAIDGSEASQKALNWMVQEHHIHPELQVTILFVHEPFLTATAAYYVPTAYDYKEFSQMPKPTPAEEAMNHFPNQSNVSQKSVIGNPAACILEEAEAGEYDAIVLGAKGHGVVASVLTGSVSAKILHHAGCSVLIVR